MTTSNSCWECQKDNEEIRNTRAHVLLEKILFCFISICNAAIKVLYTNSTRTASCPKRLSIHHATTIININSLTAAKCNNPVNKCLLTVANRTKKKVQRLPAYVSFKVCKARKCLWPLTGMTQYRVCF